MFELQKTFHFEAGHVLAHHNGKCSTPHGHSYILTVCIRAEKLELSGAKKNMVVDFDEISLAVKPMLYSYLDHKWLNDSLQTDSPTAEFIAKWIYEHLEPRLPGLYAIELNETASSKVVYKKA